MPPPFGRCDGCFTWQYVTGTMFPNSQFMSLLRVFFFFFFHMAIEAKLFVFHLLKPSPCFQSCISTNISEGVMFAQHINTWSLRTAFLYEIQASVLFSKMFQMTYLQQLSSSTTCLCQHPTFVVSIFSTRGLTCLGSKGVRHTEVKYGTSGQGKNTTSRLSDEKWAMRRKIMWKLVRAWWDPWGVGGRGRQYCTQEPCQPSTQPWNAGQIPIHNQ